MYGLRAVCQPCDLQVFTHQLQGSSVQLDKCRAGGTTTQCLNTDAACAREEVEEVRIFHPNGKNIEKSRLDAIDNGPCIRRLGRFQATPLGFTSHHTYRHRLLLFKK